MAAPIWKKPNKQELLYKLLKTAVKKKKSPDTQQHSGVSFCTNISRGRINSTAIEELNYPQAT